MLLIKDDIYTYNIIKIHCFIELNKNIICNLTLEISYSI